MYIGYTNKEKRLARKLYRRGLTLVVISQRVGCNTGTLSKWFKNLPKIKKCGPPKGNKPWNKGKPHLKVLGNKFAFKGPNVSKNAGNRRAQVLFKIPEACKKCGILKKSFHMIRHHKNGNTLDNQRKNIEWLCRSCHINHHRKNLK